jgi:hypothetical protein
MAVNRTRSLALAVPIDGLFLLLGCAFGEAASKLIWGVAHHYRRPGAGPAFQRVILNQYFDDAS